MIGEKELEEALEERGVETESDLEESEYDVYESDEEWAEAIKKNPNLLVQNPGIDGKTGERWVTFLCSGQCLYNEWLEIPYYDDPNCKALSEVIPEFWEKKEAFACTQQEMEATFKIDCSKWNDRDCDLEAETYFLDEHLIDYCMKVSEVTVFFNEENLEEQMPVYFCVAEIVGWHKEKVKCYRPDQPGYEGYENEWVREDGKQHLQEHPPLPKYLEEQKKEEPDIPEIPEMDIPGQENEKKKEEEEEYEIPPLDLPE